MCVFVCVCVCVCVRVCAWVCVGGSWIKDSGRGSPVLGGVGGGGVTLPGGGMGIEGEKVRAVNGGRTVKGIKGGGGGVSRTGGGTGMKSKTLKKGALKKTIVQVPNSNLVVTFEEDDDDDVTASYARVGMRP